MIDGGILSRTCKICGESYKGAGPKGLCEDCKREEIEKLQRREDHLRGLIRFKSAPGSCQRCEKLIVLKSRHAKFCTACAVVVRREKMREYLPRYRKVKAHAGKAAKFR